MRFFILISATILMSASAFAQHYPDKIVMIRQLSALYQGNPRFNACMHLLNFPPKPLSIDASYILALKGAAYAEGITLECK